MIIGAVFWFELGNIPTAAVAGHVAARVVVATGRWIDGTGHFTAENDAFTAAVWVGLRNRREQSHGVRMFGIAVNILCPCVFDNFAQVHHGYVIADVFDYR